MALTLTVIVFLQNEWTSNNYYFNAFALSGEIAKVVEMPEKKITPPSFVTYSEPTERNLAIVSMTTMSKIPSNQPVDIEVNIMPIADNSFIENSGSIPYELKIEQRGKVIYQFVGFAEDSYGVVSPEFLKGPALVTLNIASSPLYYSPQSKSLAQIARDAVPTDVADRVIFRLNAD